jgi:hypothetical protein
MPSFISIANESCLSTTIIVALIDELGAISCISIIEFVLLLLLVFLPALFFCMDLVVVVLAVDSFALLVGFLVYILIV